MKYLPLFLSLLCSLPTFAQLPELPAGVRVINPPTKPLNKGVYQLVLENGDTAFYFSAGSATPKKIIHVMDSAYMAEALASGRKTLMSITHPNNNSKTNINLLDFADKLPCEAKLCYKLDASELYLEIETVSFAAPYTCLVTEIKTGKVLFSQKYNKTQSKTQIPFGILKSCVSLSVQSQYRTLSSHYCKE